MDYGASQYVVHALAKLEEGEWPISTFEEEFQLLRWRFGPKDQTLHELEMIDAAGQDLRSILLDEGDDVPNGEEVEGESEHREALRRHIAGAEVLVYLFDPGSLYASGDLAQQNENVWLLKTFLTCPEWKRKRRIVVLSKADVYGENLEKAGGDLRAFVAQSLPRNWSMEHLIEEEDVEFVAVASVHTETIVDEQGTPRRVPRQPLTSSGMHELLQAWKPLPPLPHELALCMTGGALLGVIGGALAGVILDAMFGLLNDDPVYPFTFLGLLFGWGFGVWKALDLQPSIRPTPEAVAAGCGAGAGGALLLGWIFSVGGWAVFGALLGGVGGTFAGSLSHNMSEGNPGGDATSAKGIRRLPE